MLNSLMPKGYYQTRHEMFESIGFYHPEKISDGKFRCKHKPEKGMLKEFTSYVGVYKETMAQMILVEIVSNDKNLEPFLKAYEPIMKQRDFILLLKKTI